MSFILYFAFFIEAFPRERKIFIWTTLLTLSTQSVTWVIENFISKFIIAFTFFYFDVFPNNIWQHFQKIYLCLFYKQLLLPMFKTKFQSFTQKGSIIYYGFWLISKIYVTFSHWLSLTLSDPMKNIVKKSTIRPRRVESASSRSTKMFIIVLFKFLPLLLEHWKGHMFDQWLKNTSSGTSSSSELSLFLMKSAILKLKCLNYIISKSDIVILSHDHSYIAWKFGSNKLFIFFKTTCDSTDFSNLILWFLSFVTRHVK